MAMSSCSLISSLKNACSARITISFMLRRDVNASTRSFSNTSSGRRAVNTWGSAPLTMSKCYLWSPRCATDGMMSKGRTDHFPIRYLSTSDVVRVAREVVGTAEGHDREALYLALRRTAEGRPTDLEARIHDFAASLLEGLLSFHPFAVGNEEIARRAGARLYELNSWTLADAGEVVQLVGAMRGGRASVFAGAAVLARHARRSA